MIYLVTSDQTPNPGERWNQSITPHRLPSGVARLFLPGDRANLAVPAAAATSRRGAGAVLLGGEG